jgi:phage terminase Nu1 subunit (DNA packaging protein)
MSAETTTTALLVPGRELARLLNCSERTLFNLRAKGMPFLNLGNAIRYEPAACLEWLRANNAK